MNLEIADRLTSLRKTSNLSQEMLAEKLNVSRQAVSKWERGEACPDMDNLIQLAELYQISLDSLIRGEERKETSSEEPVTPPAPRGDCQDSKSFTSAQDYMHVSQGDIAPPSGISTVASAAPPRFRSSDFSLSNLITCIAFLLPLSVYGILSHYFDSYPFYSYGGKVCHILILIFLIPPIFQTMKKALLGLPAYPPAKSISARFFLAFPYPFIISTLHLFIGMIGSVSSFWILYFTIPIYDWTIQQIFYKKKKDKFQIFLSFPICCVVLFFIMGSATQGNLYVFLGLLIVPIYYVTLFLLKKHTSVFSPFTACKKN